MSSKCDWLMCAIFRINSSTFSSGTGSKYSSTIFWARALHAFFLCNAINSCSRLKLKSFRADAIWNQQSFITTLILPFFRLSFHLHLAISVPLKPSVTLNVVSDFLPIPSLKNRIVSIEISSNLFWFAHDYFFDLTEAKHVKCQMLVLPLTKCRNVVNNEKNYSFYLRSTATKKYIFGVNFL